ncbi:elongator complex protein 1-like [Schistocerca gregaria]|uniref:elongator complex protein 1-like n=1 Tax=Schistocerca gregaria TaxID=7010 RepID=UPI00211DCC98|nr:elongator complex protein 1-like [Schistocerca gregaria]
MMNLRMLAESRVRLGLEPGVEVVRFCVVPRLEWVYVVTSDERLLVFEARGGKEVKGARRGRLPSGSGAVSLSYTPESDSVWMCLDSGEVFEFDVGAEEGEEEGPVGVVKDGIESVGWCGDEEYALYVTKGGHVLMMTQELEVVMEKTDVGRGGEVAWRGDGRYFAVSRRRDGGDGYELVIWDRMGNEVGRSEALKDGCQSRCVAWSPNGEVLVSVDEVERAVVLFEKNGLRNGKFRLRGGGEVEQMRWSRGGDTLGLLIREGGERRLELWSRKNYHWYLKYELRYEGRVMMEWGRDGRMDLLVMTSTGELMEYRFEWVVDRDERGMEVGVVDGSKVLTTSFERACIPPPMSESEVELGGGGVAGVGYEKKWEKAVEGLNGRWMRQLVVVDREEAWAVVSDGREEALARLKLGGCRVVVEAERALSGRRVKRLSMVVGSGGEIVCEYEDGEVKELTGAWSRKLPECCEWIEGIVTEEGGRLVVGLSSEGRLYAGEKLVSQSCTSFGLGEGNLVYTTYERLFVVRVGERWGRDGFEASNIAAERLRSGREVEKGSTLVAIDRYGSRVVLQTERGNLEQLEPRELVMGVVDGLLADCQYGKALEVMNRQRVDLNYVYEYDSAKFMEHVRDFLEQAKGGGKLEMWMGTLNSAGCGGDLDAPEAEASWESQKLSRRVEVVERPVNRVCRRLREEMVKLGRREYLCAIMLSWVKQDPANVEEALRVVIEEEEGREERLEHLSYFVDRQVLYEHALGTYDIGLARWAAGHTQMDPKEYKLELSRLESHANPVYREYCIDRRLGRWPAALEKLGSLGSDYEDEWLELVREQQLYLQAISSTHASDRARKCVWKMYGDHLVQKKNFREASLAYWRACQWSDALEHAVSEGDWRSALSIAHEGKLFPSSHDFQRFISDMAESCRRRFQYADAAHLWTHYAMQPLKAFPLLLEGHLWQDAILLCLQYPSLFPDSISSQLVPSLLRTHSVLLEEASSHIKELIQRHDALLSLRFRKSQRLHSDLDSISSYSTTTSRSTASRSTASYSTGTRSTSTRHKKPSSRPGSSTEEEYLLYRIPQLLFTPQLQARSYSLLSALSHFDLLPQALALSEKLKSWLELSQFAIPLIDTPSPPLQASAPLDSRVTLPVSHWLPPLFQST